MGATSSPPRGQGSTGGSPERGRPGTTSPTDANRDPGAEGSGAPLENDASSAPSSAIEPDFSTDDEGYQTSLSTSYVTSLASDIRRGIEENGRIYAAYGIHRPWVPVDDMEVGSNSNPYDSHQRQDWMS